MNSITSNFHFLILIFLFNILYTKSAPSTDEDKFFKGYKECNSHEDCDELECCTLGMQRYSVPMCSPYGLENDPCIPTNPKPKNFSLSYPNTRKAVEIKNAYLLLCPCKSSLICDRESNACLKNGKRIEDTSNPNYL